MALAPVQVGEELCINYTDVDQPEALRRQDLRHYGFLCQCSKCAAERGAEGAEA